MGDVAVPFTLFDKNNLMDFNYTDLCGGALNFTLDNLCYYNDCVFVKISVKGKDQSSYTRIYIIDTKIPTNPELIGYVDFPYTIKDIAFHNDYLYISISDSNVSKIYKYDPSKIIPVRAPIDQTQEGEDQTSQESGDQSSQDGGNTSEDSAASEETTAGTEENNEEQSSHGGGNTAETGTGTEGTAPQTGEGDGNDNAQGNPASINNSIQYWAAFYPWWQINSMQINLLMDNYPSLFPTPRNPLIEKPPYIFYPSLPFDLFPKPICLDPSTDNWYLPPLPYSYLNLILDYDRMNYNLFSFYPIAEIPDLLYFLYGIKIDREPGLQEIKRIRY
ncbi:hypothetical protein JXL19_10325 [bacterium]|nr:hypothetical protein [bacterium]